MYRYPHKKLVLGSERKDELNEFLDSRPLAKIETDLFGVAMSPSYNLFYYARGWEPSYVEQWDGKHYSDLGIHEADYEILPESTRAYLHCLNHLNKYAPLHFYAKWLETYYPNLYAQALSEIDYNKSKERASCFLLNSIAIEKRKEMRRV